ncbi:MAG: DUF1800 domain-containing protein [Verrucomicrobiales bacterium]|nr:DUF1800 domain-containing protein [Verrucomicrobiales bacterium]
MRNRLGLIGGGIVLLLACLANSSRAQVAGAIAVYPETSSIEIGSSRQFSAYVPISPNTITWSVNDIVGGNTTIGTISAAGLYQAPTVAPAANVVTVKARSTAFPTSVGSATLTITRRYPWLWSVSPSPLTTGNYTVRLNGANFAPDSKALANGVELATTYISSTRLDASGAAAAAGSLQFAVRQPGPGAVTGNVVSVTVNTATTTVAISPTSASVALGSTRTFSATVSGTANKSVTWSVNGVVGGSSSVGTISSSGVYTAPAALPASPTVTVRATSVATPTAFAQATVTLTVPPPPPVTVAVSPASTTVQLGASQAFTAVVSGTNNTAVTWSVNGTVGGSATVGTISAAGFYTAPAAMPSPATVTVRAVSVASPSSSGQSTVTLTSPPVPPVTPSQVAAARFLEQSSFGPSPATLERVAQVGIEAFLDEQFTLPETPIPLPSGNSAGSLRQWALYNYSSAPDQLRQRVAYSLSQIVVTSGTKLVYADELVPWLRLLSQHAFGNYRDLLRDVTKCPSMGKFLDLANSMKPGMGGGANENYPRELMQLFTIGLWMLNQDGSQQTNAAGQPIPAYTQETVRQVALALTGWTYATAPNATPQNANWEYFGAPMETRQGNHDTTAKTFLGTTLPAGQTVEQDLEGVLDTLMHHPNIAPFIATRLIRSLVMSNPSGAYIQRVADVFVDNGAGVRGDLKAVVRAILLDPEARQDTATVNQGRLKEPILHISGFLRALNGRFTSGQQVTYLFDYMAQGVLTPPSVFSWFSPLYRVPNSPLFGPEFQIYTPTEATLRGNFFHAILNYPGSDFVVDLAPFQPYGNDMVSLVEKANQVLLYGRMPAAMKQVIINAAAPGYDAKTRIETALYLTALTGQYAIQH